jgi:hypothetical protein
LSKCRFTPHIHANNIKHDILGAKEVVNDPESYEKYIKKRQLIKSRQQEQENRRVNAPGSGNIWKDKLTIPKEFIFNGKGVEKEKRLSRPASSALIIVNPVNPANLSIMDLKNNNSVYTSVAKKKVDYDDAIAQLRNELHNLDLNEY